MKKIEAFIRPSVIELVVAALHEIGVEGMSLTEIKGFGKQKGHVEHYRGSEYTINLLPKIKVEIFIADDLAQEAVEAILRAARTGEIGDGKIFTSTVETATRIRTGETGEIVV